MKDIKTSALEDEIIVLTNISKQAELEIKVKKLNAANDEIERKLKEKALHIDTLEIENILLKQKNTDLVDELLIKKKEIEEAEEAVSLKTSHSSLKEELSQLNVIECDECNLSFSLKAELTLHKQKVHEIVTNKGFLSKLSALEINVSKQKIKLVSSALQLKTEEMKKLCSCKSYCRKFCRINHQKYNFAKSKCDELLHKLNKFSTSPKVYTPTESFVFGAKKKQYSCAHCEDVFQKQGELKKHKKQKHNQREKKIGK